MSERGAGVFLVLLAQLLGVSVTAHAFVPLGLRVRAAQIQTPPGSQTAGAPGSQAAGAPGSQTPGSQIPGAFGSQTAGAPGSQTPGAPAAATPASAAEARALASEGRRLMNEGRLIEAREKLRQAVATGVNAEPEWVFDLGHCAERLHRDDEALEAFRKYLTLPLTLRAAEAERRIAAIDERRNPSATETDEPKTPPRYVLVPTKADKGKCVRSCDASSACGRFVGKAGADQCEAARFSCFRNCAGARVHAGLCPQSRPQAPTACLPDRRGWAAPGLITPLRY